MLYAASNPTHLCNFHRTYIKWLSARGWQVWALCGGTADLEGVFRFVELPLVKRMWSCRNFRTALRLAKLLRQERFDLVYVHTSLAAFFVRLAVCLAGKGDTRVVNMVHGYLFDDKTPLLKRRLLFFAEKLCAGVTDLVMTMNAWDEALARRCHLAKEVRVVDGIGVPFERFTVFARAEARARLALPEDALLLLYPAEFSRRKNQRFLIENLSALPESTILALPGRGALLEDCRARAKALGLGGRVLFPGQVADLSLWYSAADLCVSASRSEGLPCNVMEAMHFARPVVATAVKGHTDLVKEGDNGFLYPYGDGEAYRDCVLTLARDLRLRAALGERGRQIAERYALARVMPQVFAALGLAEEPLAR